jgi:arabinan endo-1,5-alpha-L-arabinosidase
MKAPRPAALRPALALAIALAALAGAGGAAAQGSPAAAAPDADADAPLVLGLSGSLGAHDPTIAACGGAYYRYSSGLGIPMAVSKDLKEWRQAGAVFAKIPAWTREAIPGSTDFWAPEVVKMGDRYRIYYSVSTFGSKLSAIGMASSPSLDPASPDYLWTDEGQVIASSPTDDFNAIDPCVAFDAEGAPWMAFGSFWSGIKIVKLDGATGRLAEPGAAPLSIARRPESPDAIEGAYILPWAGRYYLFVSFDFCCRGSRSSYNMRVGRSDSITGPYLDRGGKSLLEGGGTLIRESGARYKGPGHCSVLVEGDTCYLVYHAYDAQKAGLARLRIEPLQWDDELWPYVTGEGGRPLGAAGTRRQGIARVSIGY